MRKLYLIGELEEVFLEHSIVQAIRGYLDRRQDLKVTPTVLVTGKRVHVVGIPDNVAEDLRVWFAEKGWEE